MKLLKKRFVTPAVLALIMLAMSHSVALAANPDAGLRVEVIASPNFVVDSNVESPSTYAPRSAYICAQVYNEGSVPLTDLFVNIGDFTNNTPGIYPSRVHTNDVGGTNIFGPLPGGAFAFTHEGGSAGTDDAVRYIGSLATGEMVTVYWLISYPNLDTNGAAVHGPSVKPDDDLFLFYDVWATADDGSAREASVTTKATMRNEISALANKIWPNTASHTPQELKDEYGIYEPLWSNTVLVAEPGVPITCQGIWFDLGNVEKGFDNDGDTIPDQNAWIQPVGDPSIFDSSVYRLVETRATIWASKIDGTLKRYDLTNSLYVQGIPKNNGAVGIVDYVFMPMVGEGSGSLSPYQEVASGFDNEKFNGDYGTLIGLPPPTTSRVDLVKEVDKAVAYPAERLSYTVDFTNSGDVAVGRPDLHTPLVVQDSVPTGTFYVGGAEVSNTLPTGVSSYAVLYSTNYGVSWVSSEPSPATNVTDIQWWLSDPLPTGAAGRVTFQLDVENPYTPTNPLVVNTAGLSFGSSAPFLEDDAVTLIVGTNAVGDTVFLDDGSGIASSGDGLQWGDEPGISNITVKLYYDMDADGQLDSSDYYITATNTDAVGWYIFTNLPDGKFIVQVDDYDPDLPLGSAITTPGFYAVDLDSPGTNVNNVIYLDADFGFVPAIGLTKTLTSPATNYEGDTVSFEIVVTNQLDGYGGGSVYDVWATTNIAAAKPWLEPANAWSSAAGPDGLTATNLIEAPATTIEILGLSVPDHVGDITEVHLHLSMWAIGQETWLEEVVDIEVRDGGTPIYSVTLLGTNITNSLQNSDWMVDISTNKAWTWADFNSNNISIYISATKSKAPDDGSLLLDAGGFKIVTDWISSSNNPSTTLDPVPLTDTYDADVLEYLSANPTPQNVTTNGSYPDTIGTITWDNVGPLYPQGSEAITVNFTALEPDGNAQQTTTNTAYVDNVYYQDGRPANSATDWAEVVIVPVGLLGDYVWRDLNTNGLQDDGASSGIGGVSVIATPPGGMDLGSGAGVAVTNVTDDSGYYFFTNYLGSGDVTVDVDETTLPGGSGTCTYDEDSGTSSPDGITIVTNFAHDASDGTDSHDTADFGYVDIVATIDGTVWNDLNRDGAPPPNLTEPWLTGVTVVLYEGATPIDTNTTSASGYFQFTGNFDGTYTIQVDDTSGDMSSGTWVQSFDTDDHVATPDEVTVVVPAGGHGRGDFSYYETGLYDIGDLLFYDWNGNGTNDVTEPGVPNVNMYLYIDVNTNNAIDVDTDVLLLTDVTDTNGLYLFEDLYPTNYLVEVDRADADVPELYTFTADPISPNDGISYLVHTNADNLIQDFGIQPWGYGEIGDTVWKDIIPDGFQSDLEPGISNITVSLYWVDGAVTSLYEVMETDSKGKYLFEDLPDGDYVAIVDDDDADLPVDGHTNQYIPTTETEISATLSNGTSFLDADFGFSAPGEIGDTIFWDANRNATWDQDIEDGVVGVTVSLYIDNNTNGVYDGGDTLYDTTVTTTNGYYLFDNLWPNAYVVVVTTNTGPLAGTELTADPSPENMDSMHGVELSLGQVYPGADFGYVPDGIIGDTVWLDMVIDNGIREDEEQGIPYITVSLWDTSGFVTNTETDSGGWYLFMDLPDNSYTVIVDTADTDFPTNVTQTFDADGTLDDQTIAIVLTDGHMVTVDGNSFTNELGIDFGYRGTNILSGTIGRDDPGFDGMMGTNGSGYTSEEIPFSNELVHVSFWDDDGDNVLEDGEATFLASTVTDANGDYSFTGLPDSGINDQYLVAHWPSDQTLTLTTTSNSRPVNVLFNSTNAAGYTTFTWQGVTISPTVTNVDFAFFSDYIDVGTVKYVDDAPTGATNVYTTIGSNLVYTMIITNYGPQVATELQWTDNLPTGVTYSAHTTSTGTYDEVSGIWDVGTLAVDMTATMTVTCVANANMDGKAITNWIRLSHLYQVDTNPTNNQSYAIIKPTAVTIVRFEALALDGEVAIEWETSSEIGTVGFFLLREEGNRLIPVNADLLPAMPGTPQGSIYSVTDPNAMAGKQYSYTLVEIEASGVENRYGPFSVEAPQANGDKGNGKSNKKTGAKSRGVGKLKDMDFGNMRARAKVSESKERRMGRKRALGHAKQAAKRNHPHFAGAPLMKIAVADAGVVNVTAAEFIATTGGPTNEILAAFAEGDIALSCNGEPVPYMMDAAGTSLRFYAQEIDSPYTTENVYVLTYGRATAMELLAGVAPPIGAPATFVEDLHFEEDIYSVSRLIPDPDADSWMWCFFVGDHATYGNKVFTLASPGASADEEATLTVRLHGSSNTGVEDEHVVTVVVNGTEVGSGAWTGMNPYELDVTVPAGVLNDGDNTVKVIASKAAGAAYSVTYLNEFDLSYRRRLEADGDRMLLRDAEGGEVTVGGFVSDMLSVWDIEEPGTPVALQGVTIEDGKASFTTAPGHDYFIFGQEGLIESAQMAPMQAGILKARTNVADYLVITVPELQEGADALAAYRAGLGLKSQTVLLEGIYDEFSYGIQTPQAIKAFLSYAHSKWAGKPRYVVLAGEGTYDYKGTQGTEDCLVPPMRVETPSGQFASDSWFVDFDGDRVPELPIGRLPVISNEELTNLVAKIVAYEAEAEAEWQTKALLIADDRDDGGNFRGAAELLARHLPATYSAHKAYLDDGSIEDTRTDLLSALNTGAAFVSYFGHSGLDRLADEGLLTSEDVDGLANGSRLPVFTSMSCVMGRFAVPGYDCLAEELLLKQDGGCVAVWSPSGMAMNPFSRVLGEAFYAAVFAGGQGVLGDAMLSATKTYADLVPGRNALVVFNLLGDPALRVLGRPYEAYPAELGTYERWAEKWIAKSGLDDADAARDADPDGDGMSNYEEYVLGSNPLKANGPRGLRLVNQGKPGKADEDKWDGMEIVYERSKHASDVKVILLTSEDLITWYRNGYHVIEETVTDNGDGLTETVTVRIRHRGSKKRCFARLLLEPQP